MMRIIGEIFRPEPKILYLEPFFGCNYRCLFCIHGSGQEITSAQLGPLLFEKLKPLIENVIHIHMTGLGEPFLNPHLLDYLSYFKEKGKSYYINTNGSLIEDAHIELMTTSKSELSVSIDAGDRETYGRIRQGGNWERILARLKRVSRMRADRNAAYPKLCVNYHINAVNLMSLKKIPELARELGIEAVKLSWTMLPPMHRAFSVFKSKDRVKEVVDAVCDELQKAGIQVRNEALFSKHVRGCWDFSPMTFIDAKGTVAACCSRWPTIGHLDHNRFEDIWNGMPRRRLALAVLNRRPEGECADCRLIRVADYEQNEEDFLKPADLDTEILADKTRSIGKLPSLEGLEEAFHSGVAALTGGNPERAVSVFSTLETKFPEYFEIKNNLAVAHYYLGNLARCREILDTIGQIPHNERIIRSNRKCSGRVSLR